MAFLLNVQLVIDQGKSIYVESKSMFSSFGLVGKIQIVHFERILNFDWKTFQHYSNGERYVSEIMNKELFVVFFRQNV